MLRLADWIQWAVCAIVPTRAGSQGKGQIVHYALKVVLLLSPQNSNRDKHVDAVQLPIQQLHGFFDHSLNIFAVQRHMAPSELQTPAGLTPKNGVVGVSLHRSPAAQLPWVLQVPPHLAPSDKPTGAP
eukprot:CAMPEP_0181448662 /NCGR_PEP_ID=MMETSP1110-20121109/27254_1 /TAXON_ID=174948 /ORGANISM="Symbiodinium sp., Strain CCMP421" /LENGTH=127 /DNA_ID=CAMNT_0023572815 /DNA_START=242 /DNA_END=626 /DNA_ORIENTATION=-